MDRSRAGNTAFRLTFVSSWQIVPRRFMELIRDRNPGKVKAVMEAMTMRMKLDVAVLERAYNEA